VILAEKKCLPCQGGVAPLPFEKAGELLVQIPEWEFIGGQDGCPKALRRRFEFKNFVQALSFTDKVGEIAEEESHHPDISLGWGYCEILIQTHKIDGLHENDFILAAKIDAIS